MYKLSTAREEMIEKNMGLAYACAHKFKGRGIEYDDLFQAGCVGLIKAADAFDETRGVRFSTYAVPVILGEIRRLFRDGGTVKVSRTLKELSMKIARLREEENKRSGEELSVSQVAERLGVEESLVIHALTAMSPTLSLTESEEEGGGQIDLPVDSPEEQLSDLLSLAQVVRQLEVRDQRLITLRYFGGKTQTQTAQELGMTQVQVSRREKKILQALRAALTG